MKNINSQIKYFNSIRDELLASLCSGNHDSFEKIFADLKKTIKSNPTLTENAQKSLYQINSITKKYNKNNHHTFLNQFLKTLTRLETKNPETIDYNTWKADLGIDDKTLKTLFSTTVNFQLSIGCSNFCRRCNEWALPGVRKHFSYKAVIKIAENLAKENNKEYALYSASDPLDWQENDKNIQHIIDELSKRKYIPAYGLLTKVPKGKEIIFKHLIQQGTDISASITSLNRKRIASLEDELSITIHKQHDTDDLLIPAGRDEDFCTIKSSITDSYGTEITPDGAFIVAPTYTSALNPTGQKRIPIDQDTKFFIKKMVGTKGLKFDYFENLQVIDSENNHYKLDYLLDPQIENLLLDNGDYDVTQPGMISLKEFFDTFKPKAVDKRKDLLPSVKKRFQKDYTKKEYKIKLTEYRNLCDQKYVTELKYKTILNFISSIKQYLKKNNTKRLIIRHLRKNEMALFNKNQTSLCDKAQIEKLIKIPDFDTFKLFNQIVFRLLDNPDNVFVTDLINILTIK